MNDIIQHLIDSRQHIAISKGKTILVNNITKEETSHNRTVEYFKNKFPQYDIIYIEQVMSEEAQRYINVVKKENEELRKLKEEEKERPEGTEIDMDLLEINARLCFTDWIGIHQWSLNDEPVKLERIINEIWCHRDILGKNKIPIKNIEIYLNTKKDRERSNAINQFGDLIKYEPNQPELFEDLCRLICKDRYDDWYPIILYHHLWTFKRRFYGKPDYCPLLVNFYGPAGCGKDNIVYHMFSIVPSIIKTFVQDLNKVFNNEEQSFRFIDFFFMYLGEMAKAEEGVIEKVKNIIDSRQISYRGYYTQRTIDGPNNALLVGSSNSHIKNIIVADADVRKWTEIEVHPYTDEEVPTVLVDSLKNFNWLSLWKSVDENGDSPFQDSKIYSEFRKWNTPRIITETPTVEFLRHIVETYGGQRMKSSVLWNKYKETLAIDSSKLKARNNFNQLLEKYGFVNGRTKQLRYTDIPTPEQCRYMVFYGTDPTNNILDITSNNITYNPKSVEPESWIEGVEL